MPEGPERGTGFGVAPIKPEHLAPMDGGFDRALVGLVEPCDATVRLGIGRAIKLDGDLVRPQGIVGQTCLLGELGELEISLGSRVVLEVASQEVEPAGELTGFNPGPGQIHRMLELRGLDIINRAQIPLGLGRAFEPTKRLGDLLADLDRIWLAYEVRVILAQGRVIVTLGVQGVAVGLELGERAVPADTSTEQNPGQTDKTPFRDLIHRVLLGSIHLVQSARPADTMVSRRGRVRAIGSVMPSFVVLKHDCPDGSWHHDWMIERTDPGVDLDRPLLTFRTIVLPTQSARFEAERIADHRRAYLDYEGEISGGRGSVRRLAGGSAAIEAFEPDRIVILLGSSRRLVGTGEGAHWTFTLEV